MSKKDKTPFYDVEGNRIEKSDKSPKEDKPRQDERKSGSREKSDRAVTTKDWGRNDDNKRHLRNYNDYNK